VQHPQRGTRRPVVDDLSTSAWHDPHPLRPVGRPENRIFLV